MSLKLRPGHRVFVFREYTDMRAGFDKLSMYVREKLKAKIVDGDLFLFIGKTRKRIKGICYDGTGLILIAKKLEQGKFMKVEDLEHEEITVEELDWLMCGSVVRRRKFGTDALTKIETPLIVNKDETDRARNQY